MKNIFKYRIILFSLVLFLTGTLPALADGFEEEDLDPFIPDNPDPGNASINKIAVLLVAALLYGGYMLLKKKPNTIKPC